MGKKLLMNNYSENDEIILCENFSPSGQAFYLWQNKPIYLDENELYMKVDFTNCNPGVYENILSIGLNITIWTGNNIHIYILNNTLQVNFISSNNMFRFEYTLQSKVNEIVINKDGIFIDNTSINFNKNNNEYNKVMTKLLNDSASIGSQEGRYRSNATYHLVCLRKYIERG